MKENTLFKLADQKNKFSGIINSLNSGNLRVHSKKSEISHTGLWKALQYTNTILKEIIHQLQIYYFIHRFHGVLERKALDKSFTQFTFQSK